MLPRVLLVVLCIAACARPEIVPIGAARFAPTNPDSVVTFTDRAQVGRAYDEIAMVSLEASDWSSESEFLAEIRKAAARVGADAIIVTSMSASSDLDRAATMAVTGVYAGRRVVRALAIRYRR